MKRLRFGAGLELIAAAGAVIVAGSLAGCRQSSITTHTEPVATSAPVFVDVAKAAGLHYELPPLPPPITIQYALGEGAAFLDYDNDGNLDILFVGPKLALYRGDGHGAFTDATTRTGLNTIRAYQMQSCTVGDCDNDGYDDVVISGFHTIVLLHNRAGKTFEDITKTSGLKPQPWGMSCGFGDLDGDGFLDLYISNYVAFGPKSKPQYCGPPGHPEQCPPERYPAAKGTLYHNVRNNRFEDVTTAWGVHSQHGKGLGVAFADFDGSGRMGFAVANDTVPGDLYQNQGDGRMKNISWLAGTGVTSTGVPYGGMGTDWGDYDNDGRLDLFVATFEAQNKEVYHNLGNSTFEDNSVASGIGKATYPYVAFGCKFLDYDNDGWLDLIIANGDTGGTRKHLPHWTYRQPSQLLHNTGKAPQYFEDVSTTSGDDLKRPLVGRGLATGDYDNDGRVDALVVDGEGVPLLLHNQCPNAGHWLSVRLTGVNSNRDGLGARITVKLAGRSLVRQCATDGSYLSASDKRVHFGLGAATQADELIIRWPSGRTQTLKDVPGDRVVDVREE